MGYDGQLLQSACGGDYEAILSLLVLAQPDLRRYAARSCSNSEDVNDAVQEALWILYRRVGTLRAITSFSGWLFAVVRRECFRLARRRAGTMTTILDLENESRFAARPPFELSIDLARGIESLPQHYRQIILMRDVEELTIAEIALKLGRTREAIKGNLHRGRLLLREHLSR